MICLSSYEELARILEAASDPTRWQLILLLGRHSELNVGTISTHFRLTRPAISHHLKVLKDAGVITGEKRGQEMFYSANRPRIVSALRTLAAEIENCCAVPPKPKED